MVRRITPFLMFEENAEAAMNLYVSLFRDSEIEQIERYGSGEPGAEGSVRQAVFCLGGQRFLCIDSFTRHAFGFTPAFSIFVECESEAELRESYQQLAAGGEVLMPLDHYGFSTLFGWVNDRFGVSWQLNLA